MGHTESVQVRVRHLPPLVLDAGLAMALLLVAVLDLAYWLLPSEIPPHFHVGLNSYLLVTLSAVGLALRRTKLWAGYLVWLLTEWGGLLFHNVAINRFGATLFELVWVFSLAEQCSAPVAAAGLAAEIALNIAVALAFPHAKLDIFYAVFDGIGLLGLVWLSGRAARRRRVLVDQLRIQTAELSEEQERLTRQVVATERRRIAEELQDLVIQGVERMATETAAAVAALPVDSARALDSVANIEATGRSTLAEMGRVLSLVDGGDMAFPAVARD
jgi:signal transduction histidine kinase